MSNDVNERLREKCRPKLESCRAFSTRVSNLYATFTLINPRYFNPGPAKFPAEISLATSGMKDLQRTNQYGVVCFNRTYTNVYVDRYKRVHGTAIEIASANIPSKS